MRQTRHPGPDLLSGGHAHGLYLHRNSPVHRLAPQCKILAGLCFILAVVSTPRESVWAFGIYVCMVLGVSALSRVPLAHIGKRLVFETPFLLFALSLPLVGPAPDVEVFGMGLSIDGLWALWNIWMKATLGFSVSIILAATTPIAELLHGLEHLRMPRIITAITGFMVRYADVITGEMRRMKIARASRAYDPRWLWEGRALAATAGALFIRSYERGERVYLAMVSRGYDGSLPVGTEHSASVAQWAAAATLPAGAAVVAALAWLFR